MRNLFSFLLCAAIPFAVQAQVKTAQAMVYFQSDKFDIAHAEIKNLDSVYFSLNANEIDSIYLNANTDSKGSNAYNKKLSEKRAQSILDYLYDNITEEDDQPEVDLRSKPIRYKAYGEERPLDDNNAEKGRKRNRRVEVVFYYHTIKKEKPVVVIDTPKENDKTNNPKNPTQPCIPDNKRDTTLIFDDGLEAVMTVEQAKSKCISISSLMTPDKIREANVTTTTEGGSPLMSAGMFEVKSCDGECFKPAIKVRMPYFDDCLSDFRTYESEGGKWVLSKKVKTRKKKRKNKTSPNYIEYTVVCPRRINGDKPKCICESIEKKIEALRASKDEEALSAFLNKADTPTYLVSHCHKCYRRLVLKMPRGFNIEEMYISTTCPNSRNECFVIKKSGKNFVVAMNTSDYLPTGGLLEILAADNKGNHYQLKNKNWTNYPQKRSFFRFRSFKNLAGTQGLRRFSKLIFVEYDFELLNEGTK